MCRPVRASSSLLLAAWLCGASGLAHAELAPQPTAAPPASAPSAPARTSQPTSVATKGNGLAVLVAGDDEPAAAACRALAKKVYRSSRLRPSIDEASARALCGANPTEPAEAASLAELRRALSAPLDGAGARALLESIARRVPSEGLVVVERVGDELRASLLRTDPTSSSAPLRPGRASLALGPAGAELRLAETLSDLEQLLGPPPAPAVPATPTGPREVPPDLGAEHPAGPRREPAPVPPLPAEGGSLASSPWFWVAVGSVAAIGLSILIVSQATNVDESSVRLQGRVLP